MLSIIMPAYNEEALVGKIIDKVLALDVDKEVIVVDDASTDRTAEIVRKISRTDTRVRLEVHDCNAGKGAAVRTGISRVRGSHTVIQDADLEYEPEDVIRLYQAALQGHPVVYGSRNMGPRSQREISSMCYYLGGVFLSSLTNFLYNARLTDINTCYKLFETRLLRSIPLESTGFEFCEEVTARILKQKIRILELPIQYHPRDFDHGKKIRWIDGIVGIRVLLKYRFFA